MSVNEQRAYLRGEQYRTPANLGLRQSLHDRFSTNPLGWHRWMFDRLQLPPRCRVLEIGCGAGALWQTNRARVPAGWHVVLSDFSSGMLAAACAAVAPHDGAFVTCSTRRPSRIATGASTP